jgi:hypothetical protein
MFKTMSPTPLLMTLESCSISAMNFFMRHDSAMSRVIDTFVRRNMREENKDTMRMPNV